MQKIDIKNKDIINLLNNFSSWFEILDKSKIKISGKQDKKDYYTR
jgi:hypothetical protein